jgi:predicted enzyme related to lactoylglutathione lyase
MKLSLLVIRSAIPAELSQFYAHFGYNFDYHRHGNGPWHYAGTLDGLTLEIYPLKQSQSVPDRHLRLGFSVEDMDGLLEGLGAGVLLPPTESEWGRRAVVVDPEGRRVEITEAGNSAS